jgi:hypothetical protein
MIREAPQYNPGDTLAYEGVNYTELENRPGDVEVGVPTHGKLSRGGDVVRIPSGNVRTISKCDLVLATFAQAT